MRTSLYLKTQAEILAELQVRLTDTGNALATAAQYYAAINEAIRMWSGRVTVPMFYTITAGFTSGTYEYALPAYIRPPFRVQVKSSTYSYLGVRAVDDDTNYTWDDISGYSVEPTAAGGFTLRLPISPMSEDARVLWYAENGPLHGGTSPTQSTASVNATATTFAMTVNATWPDVGPTGYLKVDEEFMSYSALERTSATAFTVSGLVRGLYGSVAGTHTSGDNVLWCTAVDDQRLWVQLLDYATGYVHALQLHKSTMEDMGRHEKLMSFYYQKANDFWRKEGYVGQRSGTLRLSHQAMGAFLR